MRVRAVADRLSAPAVARLLSALAVALVGGCAEGPDFKVPAAPPVTSYLPPDSTAPADTGPREPQRWIEGMDIPGQWWTVFHSRALDELIGQAFRANPSIEAAQAALRQADESYAAQRGAWLPTVQAAYSVERQRNALGTLAPTLSSGESVFTLHTAQVN